MFAERFNLTIRNLFKRPVFEKGGGKWKNILPTITKQYWNRIHSSTKLTMIQGILENNEGSVYKNLKDKQKNKSKVWSKRFRSSCWFKENVLKNRDL